MHTTIQIMKSTLILFIIHFYSILLRVTILLIGISLVAANNERKFHGYLHSVKNAFKYDICQS